MIFSAMISSEVILKKRIYMLSFPGLFFEICFSPEQAFLFADHDLLLSCQVVEGEDEPEF